MRTTFPLQDRASDKSTSLSEDGVASLPASLRLVRGSFNPDAVIRPADHDRRIGSTAFAATSTIFEATRLSKDLVTRVSGEGGLSHLLYQQVGGPINQLLKAILGTSAAWSIKAHGPAPMEDWRLLNAKGLTVAVMELKTSPVLTKYNFDAMMISLHQFSIGELPLSVEENPSKNPPKSPPPTIMSLVAGYDQAKSRSKRQNEVKALEQVSASTAVLTRR